MKFQTSLFACLMATGAAAAPLEFTGAIGPYAIELQLERTGYPIGDHVEGRYRYKGKTSWITLNGESFASDALQLEESLSGKITGQFYLNHTDQSLRGYWVNESSDHEVQLSPVNGNIQDLFAPAPQPEVSDTLTGKYETGSYWVNGLFAPNYEIGFNGGTVNVVELSTTQILVGFDFVVGPTYHLASFLGQAGLAADGSYVHDAVLEGGDEPCRLVFRFEAKSLSIEDNGNGFACQFGARAHANFELQKVSNTAEFNAPY